MRRLLAVLTALVSLFFIFYSVRLLVVTGFLRHTRAGGSGAYIGAFAFPMIAVVLGWATFMLWPRR